MYARKAPTRNRGHHYNHSTFCDLILTLLGLRPRADRTLHVRPLLPHRTGVRYFAVDGLRIHGRDGRIQNRGRRAPAREGHEDRREARGREQPHAKSRVAVDWMSGPGR